MFISLLPMLRYLFGNCDMGEAQNPFASSLVETPGVSALSMGVSTGLDTNGKRVADRIDTTPRYTDADAVRLNNMFRGRDTVEMLTVLLRENMLGDAAIVSSFGAESAVLLHLIASIDPSVPVLFLETGKHFPETITYRKELRQRLGFTDLRILTPDPAMLIRKDET